jgi:putative ABC transport system substrate-binding protein
MPVIGFLASNSAESLVADLAAVRQGLGAEGYIEGRDIAIECRYADFQHDRLPALAADLVLHQVAVIFATGSVRPAVAAKAASTTIPIVFLNGSDPVKLGLVASLSRPGGNATGVSLFGTELSSKRLELLHELLPKAAVIAFLVNPAIPIPNRTLPMCRRQPESWACKFCCSTPAAKATSMLHLRRSSNSGPMRF